MGVPTDVGKVNGLEPQNTRKERNSYLVFFRGDKVLALTASGTCPVEIERSDVP